MKKKVHSKIQETAKPPSATINWIHRFQYDFLSLAHRCEGILAHSSLQRHFSSLRWTSTAFHFSLSSGLWLDRCRTAILFFFSHSCYRFCCWDLCSCWITQLWPNFRCWRGGLTLEDFIVESMTPKSPGSVAAQQPIHHRVTLGVRCSVFGFHPTQPGISTFVYLPVQDLWCFF